jgi:hypothetical protein
MIVALPMILGLLPRNWLYGVRTRYEKAQPGLRLQVDVKFLERIPGTRRRFYQFTAIDDCTRIRVLKVYDDYRGFPEWRDLRRVRAQAGRHHQIGRVFKQNCPYPRTDISSRDSVESRGSPCPPRPHASPLCFA